MFYKYKDSYFKLYAKEVGLWIKPEPEENSDIKEYIFIENRQNKNIITVIEDFYSEEVKAEDLDEQTKMFLEENGQDSCVIPSKDKHFDIVWNSHYTDEIGPVQQLNSKIRIISEIRRDDRTKPLEESLIKTNKFLKSRKCLHNALILCFYGQEKNILTILRLVSNVYDICKIRFKDSIYREYLEKMNKEEIEEFKTLLLSENTPKIIKIELFSNTSGEEKELIIRINKSKKERATNIVNKLLSCKTDEDYENFKGKYFSKFLIQEAI